MISDVSDVSNPRDASGQGLQKVSFMNIKVLNDSAWQMSPKVICCPCGYKELLMNDCSLCVEITGV